jgi:hypothetical protein
MEAMISIGLCALAFSIFYAAIAEGFRIVKNARAHAAASQLLEQRFEALRARIFWSSMITARGLQAAVAEQPVNSAVLTDVSEVYDVAAYPDGSTAFAVTRHADGSVTTTGTSLPTSERAVKSPAQSRGERQEQAPDTPERLHGIHERRDLDHAAGTFLRARRLHAARGGSRGHGRRDDPHGAAFHIDLPAA